MQVDYFTIARRGRLTALKALDRRQPELPGMSEPTLWKDDAFASNEPDFDLGTARVQAV
ncbi:MAG: hypothetical protein AAFN80_16225 [Pseudomonadota bacterium]